MRIQDVESKTGLDRATIRFYEKEQLITPKRHDNGYRSYSDDDVSLLLKVKLLRQLGLSLAKIKNLQQGSEAFSDILSQQVEVLSKQIDNDMAAKEVCLTMQQERVSYDSLDSVRYLNMLMDRNRIPKPVFQERVQREVHPWRRFFARSIDSALTAALVSFMVVIVFRIRPFSADSLRVLGYLSNIIAIPFLALFLHLWGTTPGKWAMGIRIEHINGGNLSFSEALHRELAVFWFGEGLEIPVVSLWRLIKSYKNDVDGEGNPWNSETEIIYTDWNHVKKATIGILVIGSFALSITSSMDTMLPKYRDDGITLQEFVRNYTDYEKTLGLENTYFLTENGQWDKETQDYIIIGGDPDHIRPNFSYTFDQNGSVIGLRYSDHWNDAEFISPIPGYCTTAMYALIGSRPGSNYNDLVTAEELIVTEIYNKVVEATKLGSFTGEFQVSDVRVSWCIDAENCNYVSDAGWMISTGENKLSYSLDLQVVIVGKEH